MDEHFKLDIWINLDRRINIMIANNDFTETGSLLSSIILKHRAVKVLK